MEKLPPVPCVLDTLRALCYSVILRGYRDSCEQERWSNPLMGWTSTADPMSNLKMTFSSTENAIRFCKKRGWKYEVTWQYHSAVRLLSVTVNAVVMIRCCHFLCRFYEVYCRIHSTVLLDRTGLYRIVNDVSMMPFCRAGCIILVSPKQPTVKLRYPVKGEKV